MFGNMEVDPSIISARSTGSEMDDPNELAGPSDNVNSLEHTPQPIFEHIPDIPDFSC